MVPGAALGQDHAMHGKADKVIVIAHRGASGERPEHTLLSYQRAIEQGADFIEPDLVPTKDGVLVARHENNIADTTDVADHPEFAARRTTKTIDGEKLTGWFTEDFTLAELKTLRAKERLPKLRPGNTKYDGQAGIPTLDDVIALAKRASKETGRTIGIYPETKHPTYFASIGLPLEQRLVDKLKAAGWDRADAPVFIQSFEVDNLKKLKKMTRVRLIQLMAGSGGPADGAQPSYKAMATPEGLKAVAAYAYGIGPELTMIQPASGPATTLVTDAHAAGLRLHPWTFRAENFFLLPDYRSGANPVDHGRLKDEILYFIGLGVDGFFTDFPHVGVEARDAPRAGG
ncbi:MULTISPECIES: glycerophosphodiester phosphodiesterase [unclassified Sphingomonas]|uniref:glycerophosphodiester phosphodiesterase n=1 Tax=Sphingomonas TaxID=13687 RepID=UPI000966F905|nr:MULTISPECIES: glycerophosphodiester phosphodiesterase [unclassified Sphingomonas]OJY51373.1 MAG: glycerophosphodiester phosphodiesterase [Sphingomonas sp. 67-41]